MGDQLVAPGGRVHRHASERRLQTDEPAEAGRDADRPGSIRAEGQRPEPGRHRGRAAAGRSTGCAAQIPGIAGLAEQRVVGGSAPGELRQVGPPDEDRAGRAQARHAGRVLGRNEVREQARAGGRAVAGRPEIIFDRDGDAVERAKRLARHHRLLGLAGFLQGALGVNEHIGAQAPVQPLDPLEDGARDLDGRQRATPDQLRQLDGRGEAKVTGGHVAAPCCATFALLHRRPARRLLQGGGKGWPRES